MWKARLPETKLTRPTRPGGSCCAAVTPAAGRAARRVRIIRLSRRRRMMHTRKVVPGRNDNGRTTRVITREVRLKFRYHDFATTDPCYLHEPPRGIKSPHVGSMFCGRSQPRVDARPQRRDKSTE